MIYVGNVVVSTPVEDILSLLREDLLQDGKIRFQRIKRNAHNVMTQCPFHANGMERKPSFGISDKGECHCFACGWSTKDFSVFVSELFDMYDGGDYGKQWIYQHMNDYTAARNIILPFTEKAEVAPKKTIISEEELDSYRYVHPYMYERHLTDSIIEKFDIGYDKERGCLTFPVKDLSGDVVFVATRSVTSKFFTLPEGENKPIYLAYMFTSGKYKKAVIVESFLNALVCWKWGIPAMALIGTGSDTQMSILRRLPVKHYVFALDNDKSGNLGISRMYRALKSTKLMSKWILPEGKDVNDLDGDIRNLKEVFVTG